MEYSYDDGQLKWLVWMFPQRKWQAKDISSVSTDEWFDIEKVEFDQDCIYRQAPPKHGQKLSTR